MIDKTPSSFEYCLILLSSALELKINKNNIMNSLIIDAARKKICLTLIKDENIYSISHENSKTNYEKLTILIDEFIKFYDLKIDKISKLYVNRGPGSFAGIRNSLSIVKAFNIVNYIEYYCYSFDDFKDEKDLKYANVPYLCDKFKIEKNLINPNY